MHGGPVTGIYTRPRMWKVWFLVFKKSKKTISKTVYEIGQRMQFLYRYLRNSSVWLGVQQETEISNLGGYTFNPLTRNMILILSPLQWLTEWMVVILHPSSKMGQKLSGHQSIPVVLVSVWHVIRCIWHLINMYRYNMGNWPYRLPLFYEFGLWIRSRAVNLIVSAPCEARAEQGASQMLKIP